MTFDDTYRTRDGSAHYTFRFREDSDGTWRVHILRQPSYGSRSDDAHSTHRLTDSEGHYICWDDDITSVQDAKRVAALWADKTQEYIRTGRRF